MIKEDSAIAGNQVGGRKAAQTNKAQFGEDWYKEIGKIGGMNSHNGGFYKNRELARTAGRLGGLKSSRAGTPNRVTRIKVRVVAPQPKPRIPLLKRLFHRERTL